MLKSMSTLTCCVFEGFDSVVEISLRPWPSRFVKWTCEKLPAMLNIPLPMVCARSPKTGPRPVDDSLGRPSSKLKYTPVVEGVNDEELKLLVIPPVTSAVQVWASLVTFESCIDFGMAPL